MKLTALRCSRRTTGLALVALLAGCATPTSTPPPIPVVAKDTKARMYQAVENEGAETVSLSRAELEKLIKEADELVSIFSAGIKTIKSRNNKN